ncbi:hypothetical protein EJ066_26425 [Mesorhizobium sp. M9A.F.Ca.ET.002.03.1.2]|uniref:AbiTii domain-containing protein n=1 Tax=Mesorhizobium sp. M9A.F.Ca.ET.002.03.1.2 TaxID=2493668 RepID=UPI000F74CFCA|nr:hypothetical protein [Mesorhizobium sp. M9A.F.Ca.ET.002.03.1.2]AZO00378.1 hypothetical protein EJ066_26425 [Mesorhizobium sp. M9A.F.Ca.ET.002.03.1.2]
MSLLREIQKAVLSDDAELSRILLKVRLLASRLGSEPLEDWVKYETEGYPSDADVPDYRVISVTYRGTWSGPFGSGIQNAPIPSYLIEKHASKVWTHRKVRESIASVEELARTKDGILSIDASNLILLLQGKVYEDWACNGVTGTLSSVAMREIVQSVRSRILELTIELEKRVPQAVEVTLDNPVSLKPEGEAAVTQIYNQTVYGNVTHVHAAQVNLSITAGDWDSMVGALVDAGLPKDAAKEFAEIIVDEKPESVEKPLGKKALAWLKKNTPKAASGAWKIGSDVLTKVATEAALQYSGLK